MQDRLDRAIYETVHDYKGGAVALAPRVGMNAGTLSNKCNPAMDTHILGLRESVPLQLTSDNFSILHAYSEALGFASIAVGDFSQVSDVALLELYANYHAEVGKMAMEVRTTFADGKIEKREVETVRAAAFAAIRANFEFIARLEAMSDE